MTKECVINMIDCILGDNMLCDCIEDYTVGCNECRREAADIAINALKEQQWIPCSERLPSAEYNFKGFLTTVKCYVENDVFIQVFVNGKFGHWDGEKLIPNDDVIAWMPLPEPYEENKNG